MDGRYKPLSQVEAERGISARLMRTAIKRRKLKAIRPGAGGHSHYFVRDVDVDAWLKASVA